MLWEIDWRIIQRMLIDVPIYNYDDDGNGNGDEIINLQEETPEDFEKKLQKLFG